MISEIILLMKNKIDENPKNKISYFKIGNT
jgi:hypothetical protein